MLKVFNIATFMKILVFLLIVGIFIYVFIGGSSLNWALDKNMRFHIIYLLDDNNKFAFGSDEGIVQTPLFKPLYAADGGNINLINFLALGFDVPKPMDAEEYSFYFKLYDFPKVMNSDRIVQQFFEDYCLYTLPHASELKKYLYDKNNLVVNTGFIEKTSANFTTYYPIPQFAVNDSHAFERHFEQNIVFYSLFLLPPHSQQRQRFITQNDMARYSIRGVEGFYQELLKSYKSKLKTLKGRDNYYYFLGKNAHDKNNMVIFKVSKQVFLLPGWREFPMPQDPRNIFITSLLLVNRIEYKVKNGSIPYFIPIVDSPEFDAIFAKESARVLVVNSVVYLRDDENGYGP